MKIFQCLFDGFFLQIHDDGSEFLKGIFRVVDFESELKEVLKIFGKFLIADEVFSIGGSNELGKFFLEGKFALNFSFRLLNMVEIEGISEISLFQIKIVENGWFYFEVSCEFIGGLFDLKEIIRV